MSRHTPPSRRSHTRFPHLSIAPSELRRLRTRLHTGDHVVLNHQEVHTILQLVDMITPADTTTPSAHRPKPTYQRQQHRPVRNHK